MRAGKLDRTITVQRFSSSPDEFGTPVEAWSDVATLRAEIVEAATSETTTSGATDATNVVFRTRFLADLANADRIVYGGAAFDIQQTKEIGRRRGLEIHCVARS